MQNQTLAVIRTRRSVKKYTDQSVPRELVEAVVEAGMYAPSGMNRQSAIILAVTDKEMRDKLSRMNLDIILGTQMQTRWSWRSFLWRSGGVGGLGEESLSNTGV